MPQQTKPTTKSAATVKKATSAAFSVPMIGADGKEVGQLPLPKELFQTSFNKALITQYVHVYQVNQRQGTASTKTRSEVRGSTKKIYRQKGTGRARHGAKKAPIFVGGGVAFGPRPRNFHATMSKRQKQSVLFGTLTQSFKEKKILGVADKVLSIEPKTKQIAGMLKEAKLTKNKILVVLPKLEKNNFVLASRNIKNMQLADAKSLNAFEILNAQKIMFFEAALPVLVSHFVKKS